MADLCSVQLLMFNGITLKAFQTGTIETLTGLDTIWERNTVPFRSPYDQVRRIRI